jgi:hypothetical protein
MSRLFAVLAAGFVVAAVGVAISGSPPPVRTTGDADGAAVLDPFPDGTLQTVVTYVHVGAASDSPVAVAVLNDGPSRALPVTVRHRPSNETLYEQRITVPATDSVVVLFHRPASYRVTVTTGRGESGVAIDETAFDCNDRTAGLVVDRDGTMTERRLATSMACGGYSNN